MHQNGETGALGTGARRMEDWLEKNGILLCNQNPWLPALEDIGCTWQDAMELIDEHRIFYSKSFKKRTAYLSPQAYWLLKSLRGQKPGAEKPLPASAGAVCALLGECPGADAALLKSLWQGPAKEFRTGLNFLLENLLATASGSSRRLGENWSELRYTLAEDWETLCPGTPGTERPQERLWALTGGIMTEKQFAAWIR